MTMQLQVEQMRVSALAADRNATPEARAANMRAHIESVRHRDPATAAQLEQLFGRELASREGGGARSDNGQDVASAMQAAAAKIREQRTANAAPAPSAEQIAREDEAFRRWQELLGINPFAAAQHLMLNQREIVAARQRRGA